MVNSTFETVVYTVETACGDGGLQEARIDGLALVEEGGYAVAVRGIDRAGNMGCARRTDDASVRGMGSEPLGWLAGWLAGWVGCGINLSDPSSFLNANHSPLCRFPALFNTALERAESAGKL